MPKGELIKNANLAKYTSWRVGGCADYLYKPEDKLDLIDFIKSKPKTPITILGLGSNVLIRDKGLRGTVIITQGKLNLIEKISKDKNTIKVEAGVSCAQFARYCAKLGYPDAAFWAGIPGTMGGALKMNAGCAGHETWDNLLSVEMVDLHGDVFQKNKNNFEISYRQVNGCDNNLFLSAVFEFNLVNADTAKNKIKELLQHRKQTQPTNIPTCGSVFRNPPNDYAARLIESLGLKGYEIGGAKVSNKHANFIENLGDASSDDIEKLILFLKNAVAEKYNINLIQEVHMIGEK